MGDMELVMLMMKWALQQTHVSIKYMCIKQPFNHSMQNEALKTKVRFSK
jgi:hypothetical protein